MTASSEFQVAFLSGTYYYTNVKPYFTLEWLKLLSLPHTCHKPRSYCWRQNHILLYCNKQSLEFGISTCDKFILLAEKDLHLLQTKLLGMKLMSKRYGEEGKSYYWLIDRYIQWFSSQLKFTSHVHKYSKNHGTMQVWANQKKSIWVLVLRLETCICSKTDAKMQGGTKQVIRVLDIEFESSWICSKTMKQGEWVQENQVKWVLVLRFYILKKLTL